MPALCHHCASFSRPIAYIRRSLWRPMCLHSAARATLEPIWRCFSLHSASFARLVVPLQQFWWPKERTRVVLQQLHRNGTFYILNIISQSERWFCLPCITIVPLLADQWATIVATIVPPFGDRGDPWATTAMTLTLISPWSHLSELLCLNSNVYGSRKAQGSCCSNYIETWLFQIYSTTEHPDNFLVAQRWHEGRKSVQI